MLLGRNCSSRTCLSLLLNRIIWLVLIDEYKGKDDFWDKVKNEEVLFPPLFPQVF